MKLTTERARELIEGAGYETRSYSPMGIYGESCLGAVTDTVLGFAASVVNSIEDVEERDAMTGLLCTGAMLYPLGLDTIVYFPRLKMQKQDDEE